MITMMMSIAMLTVIGAGNPDAVTPTYSFAKQGFSMRVQLMNLGVIGRVAFPPYRPSPNPPVDSLGVEYPVGLVEHVYGAAPWIGGLLDTTQAGGNPPLRLVSAGYEGWAGPYYEFHPGDNPADTIWRVYGRGAPKPPGWDAYWGTSLPYTPVADQNFYFTYTDTAVPVPQHIPLRLKVIQSSYAWSDPEPVMIFEHRVINRGRRVLDSVYVGWFVETDVGPLYPFYWQRNFSGYYPDIQTAYTHNPVDPGSTPIGLRLLWASQPYSRITFRWYPGPASPSTDAARYAMLSSGIIQPDQYPEISDTRFLFGAGPFILRPFPDPNPDTLVIAFALVSGQSLTSMRQHANLADSLYRTLLTSVDEAGGMLPQAFALHQNYPNPFNPATTLGFELPHASHATLTVYDVLGREIETIIDGTLEPGLHRVTWDAEGLPSGVYFYRLKAGSVVQTRKMLLIR